VQVGLSKDCKKDSQLMQQVFFVQCRSSWRWYEQLQASQLSMLLCFHATLMVVLCGRLRLVVMVVVGILVGVLLEDK